MGCYQIDWERGRAWAEIAQGNLSGALRILAAGSTLADQTGRLLLSARLLMTMLRIGAARDENDRRRRRQQHLVHLLSPRTQRTQRTQ